MTDDALKLAKLLDPIYANPKPGKPDNPTAYNRWRENMSEHCWLCRNFDKCSPGHKCRHQVDIDVQAQLGVKHDRY